MDVNLLPKQSCVVIDLASYRAWRAQARPLRKARCAHNVTICFDCVLALDGDK